MEGLAFEEHFPGTLTSVYVVFVHAYFDFIKMEHKPASTAMSYRSCLLSMRVSNDGGDSLTLSLTKLYWIKMSWMAFPKELSTQERR